MLNSAEGAESYTNANMSFVIAVMKGSRKRMVLAGCLLLTILATTVGLVLLTTTKLTKFIDSSTDCSKPTTTTAGPKQGHKGQLPRRGGREGR